MRALTRGFMGLLCLAVLWSPLHAHAQDARAQLTQSQHEQDELRSRMAAIQKEIDAQEVARKEASDALRASESAISVSNRKLAELSVRQKKATAELDELNLQLARQQAALTRQQQALAEQLRKQYQSGLSPLSAWLSGNDPAQLGRNLGYLDYVAKARSAAVNEVKDDLKKLAELQSQADEKKREIVKLVDEATEQKKLLELQKRERATVLARVEGQLAAQRAESARLERDEKRLGGVIAVLDEQIEAARRVADAARREQEARRAEEARRIAENKRQEEQRQQKLAKEAADFARESQLAARQAQAAEQAEAQALAQQAARDAREAREIAAQAARQAKQAEAEQKAAQAANAAAEAPLAGTGLRAGLRWPVRGPVMARFGSARPEGGLWRGLLIGANEGTPVQVVAGGVVVYATWLRGFGNIMIVDHGQQYLSIYAYLQSLLKQVGDPVVAGDTIATVGNTGGQLDSALYFEIRHKNAAVEPALFLVK